MEHFREEQGGKRIRKEEEEEEEEEVKIVPLRETTTRKLLNFGVIC
jgi:hypothetical protein